MSNWDTDAYREMIARSIDVSAIAVPKLTISDSMQRIMDGRAVMASAIAHLAWDPVPVTAQLDGVIAQFKPIDLSPIVDALRTSAEQIHALSAVVNTSAITSAAEAIAAATSIGNAVLAMPDLTAFQRVWNQLAEEERDGLAVLEAAGLSHLRKHVPPRDFARYSRVPERIRNATVTNALLNDTRSDRFLDYLEGLVSSTRVLRKRWPIIAEGMRAHRERRYLVSIPVLLAQLEGVITEAAVVRQLVRWDGRRLVVLNADGSDKLEDGKPVLSRGLVALINASTWRQDPTLEPMASMVADDLAPYRNGVLHGSDIAYGKAKHSVQSILALNIFVEAFAELEAATERA